ncbi:uncharacterized protein SOCE26_037330 [Sorangium cellulosum]|uniref:Uncharacterized protein n=1 Tax=Sorangium cellulosum TaxID=56 RepID=A0A2L0ESM5_SORCE|nr:uncharacterized protein SOCE26_037330 [Sorangium cellulosum]
MASPQSGVAQCVPQELDVKHYMQYHDTERMLVLVTGALSERPVVHRYSGRELLDRFKLKPIAFQASLLRA